MSSLTQFRSDSDHLPLGFDAPVLHRLGEFQAAAPPGVQQQPVGERGDHVTADPTAGAVVDDDVAAGADAIARRPPLGCLRTNGMSTLTLDKGGGDPVGDVGADVREVVESDVFGGALLGRENAQLTVGAVG